MSQIRITVGEVVFSARLEEADAPRTCAEFRKLLPYRQKLRQARWGWGASRTTPGESKGGIRFETHASPHAPGALLLPPGGDREHEGLLPQGACCFASRMGQLAGNHFLTIVEGRENLRVVGRKVLWEGAQDIVFEAIETK